jgi:hypothetical protein
MGSGQGYNDQIERVPGHRPAGQKYKAGNSQCVEYVGSCDSMAAGPIWAGLPE